jgi:hypothetical protein
MKRTQLTFKALVAWLVCASCLIAQQFEQNNSGATSNYVTYKIEGGWSLELPASWIVTKQVNNDLNEAIQSNADNTFKRLNVKQTLGNANTQLFACKSLMGEKISLIVSTQDLKNPLFQNTFKNLDESQKRLFLVQTKQGMQASLASLGCAPDSEIYADFVNYHDFIALVNEFRDPLSSSVTKCIIIPNGNNLLRLQFNYKLSAIDVWPSFITRIVESVHLP